ncbi:uncharacterized protein SCHCODRAFT_02622309 [Schizophyllum commune H4-8]|uniref:uncharacterized protein n=1 Tax=Schizophyllum commune (strain H4-8 / FGSC 9210) TaxID=578458 RepID=UPI0021603035|nr:uncharacterized protein SCHCODRAFT_02622309 [Schizophyllum commune H4-8]KAI5893625.1 hypothetical protein SCHCODRAFT_02622309 [Schizophyllum commune H4-8]
MYVYSSSFDCRPPSFGLPLGPSSFTERRCLRLLPVELLSLPLIAAYLTLLLCVTNYWYGVRSA